MPVLNTGLAALVDLIRRANRDPEIADLKYDIDPGIYGRDPLPPNPEAGQDDEKAQKKEIRKTKRWLREMGQERPPNWKTRNKA